MMEQRRKSDDVYIQRGGRGGRTGKQNKHMQPTCLLSFWLIQPTSIIKYDKWTRIKRITRGHRLMIFFRCDFIFFMTWRQNTLTDILFSSVHGVFNSAAMRGGRGGRANIRWWMKLIAQDMKKEINWAFHQGICVFGRLARTSMSQPQRSAASDRKWLVNTGVNAPINQGSASS